jgi:hypothetical protein
MAECQPAALPGGVADRALLGCSACSLDWLIDWGFSSLSHNSAARIANPPNPIASVEETAMKARIKWIENVTFLAESGSGHGLLLDGAPDAGGRNLGPRPMEMLLLGLGGCTAFDVIHILRRGR